MQHHLFWVVFVAYFTFFNKCETKQLQVENGNAFTLSQLFPKRNKPPIIVYLEPKQNDYSIEENPVDLKQLFRSIDASPNVLREEDELDEDDDENYLSTSRSDERAYLLYHLLRTTIEEEDIDQGTVQQLQPAKEFLRSAFIGRCRKLNKCMKRCPKKYTCQLQCKEMFDDLNHCDEPKENKCGFSKCGTTTSSFSTWIS